MNLNRIAIIVGHSETDPGAMGYNGVSEYDFNQKIAHRVKNHLVRMGTSRVEVFFKSGDYVKRVRDYNPELIIELHFNALNGSAPGVGYGSEALVIAGDSRAISEANLLLSEFKKRFGIKPRGVLQLVNKNQRGFRNFNGLRDIPMFIFEPCFGDEKTRESEKIIEHPDKYAAFLIDYFNYRLGFSDKITSNSFDKMLAMVRAWRKG